MNFKNRKISSRLESNHEIVGTLHAVLDGENYYKLQFISSKEIELPSTTFSYKKILSLVGKRIGILNLDGKFFVREIKK